MTDLPEIKIVQHVRAKRLRLRVEPDAVRLTVPVFCTQKQIQAFLAQSQKWLEKRGSSKCSNEMLRFPVHLKP